MHNNVLNVSENFRKMAIKSVLSIVLFLFTYVILVIGGIGVIFLCGLIAYGIMTFYASFITGMLALGCIGMGFLIFFFLIKFIFSSSKKIDRSHLVEITEKQQPELFKMIHEIVTEVKTNFPKKVYLASNVNASVFYDSNFWSMFFPVRKNLQIGIGLMNTVSVIELKAILAHEFGHFSQRSMKVGSYVYNVNKVIYNMLYENEGYGSLLNGWSNVSNYFALFARGAIMVIQGIQYILTKVYTVLNLNYMALSREMEFHADAVAASVAGSQPLANSLLRLELADQSLNIVFNYYDNKIAESQKPSDLYPQQHFVLSQMALAEELPVQNGLPILSVDNYKKFNKTKLVLDDQWSSHPSTAQRVAKLMELNLPVRGADNEIAITMLADQESIQQLITDRLLVDVKYEAEPVVVGATEFIDDYLKREAENAYPAIFKNYFDERDPYKNFTEDDFNAPASDQHLTFEELINPESTADINSLNTAMADKSILEKIYHGVLEIETFDYDGIKYTYTDAYPLITFLEAEIVRYNDLLEKRDIDLFKFFLNKAIAHNNLEEFKAHSLSYQSSANHLQIQRDVYSNLAEATMFMQTTTPFDQIIENMIQVKKMEKPFCEQIRLLLEDPFYQEHIDAEMRTKFEEYISKDWRYYGHQVYLNEEVDILYTAMFNFTVVVFKLHFRLKRSLLEFQASMMDRKQKKCEIT
jgi:Zn-dependent protease with chaperone function